MSYRNKTYIIFDGERDMAPYRFMRGWKFNKHIDFDFHDAHDINVITDRASVDTVKRKLRQRFSSAKQFIVLIGENTRHKHRFVRWEMDVALDLGLPIIAVNLNQKRKLDESLCPPILRGERVMHVAFRAKIIRYALDQFPSYYHRMADDDNRVDFYYEDNVYKELGL
jgi:MTH538 TIR-like domain (DUF1863).